MFVQHYRHCSSCRCDSPPVGLYLCYDAFRPPHVVAVSVGFSLLGVGSGVEVKGGEGVVVVVAAVVVVVEEVVLGALVRRWYLHLGWVGLLSAIVGFFFDSVVLYYVDGVGVEGVPALGIAVCQCDPPMCFRPVRCYAISGYPRPCSV